VYAAGTDELLHRTELSLFCKQAQYVYYAFDETERHFGIAEHELVDVSAHFYPSFELVTVEDVPAGSLVRIGEDGRGVVVPPGGDDSGTGGDETGGVDTTGAGDADGDASADGSNDTGGTADATSDDSASDGGDDSGAGADGDDDAGSGCGCTSASSGAPGWALLILVAIGRRRRAAIA
jgi:MYXO-CTERM domain-containing protein